MKVVRFIKHGNCTEGLVHNDLTEGEMRDKQTFALFQSRNDENMAQNRSRDKRKEYRKKKYCSQNWWHMATDWTQK